MLEPKSPTFSSLSQGFYLAFVRIPSNHQGAESQLCASKGTIWVIRNQLSSSSQTYPNSLGSHSSEYTYHRLCFLLSRLGRPSRDPLFLTKFLRLVRLRLQPTIPTDTDSKLPTEGPESEHPVRRFWFMILRRYLLPALPLIRGNAVCTVEVWNIIRQYETVARWRLYGEWKDHTYCSHPELRIRVVQADRESKGILRRLSLKTIDLLSGPVAKLAHSNPCILFQNAVNQIMAYENLTTVVEHGI